jgi:CTP:molybdopterin cytidylyltransferase MocA
LVFHDAPFLLMTTSDNFSDKSAGNRNPLRVVGMSCRRKRKRIEALPRGKRAEKIQLMCGGSTACRLNPVARGLCGLSLATAARRAPQALMMMVHGDSPSGEIAASP